ncbi:hypothetical protein C8F04DRAFT_1267677 [Mycena alexandri]|uniref:Uncharacterized protein n=1 Tax=Mycena alexandri TaxID=1745969 RepID=A0AAD6SF46_9AGAR|nr:hypothetical protein C8F04DRAFT_1267677 [Mycena alexandri]
MRPLTLDVLNPQLQTVQYAVRGELAIKAEVLRDQLKSGGAELPFDKVISSNIGNPQQKGLDQPPITFTRQVAALTEYPALATLAPNAFPEDVVARAHELLEDIGSIGAYSHSQGVPLIRKSVAAFIEVLLVLEWMACLHDYACQGTSFIRCGEVYSLWRRKRTIR